MHQTAASPITLECLSFTSVALRVWLQFLVQRVDTFVEGMLGISIARSTLASASVRHGRQAFRSSTRCMLSSVPSTMTVRPLHLCIQPSLCQLEVSHKLPCR